MVARPLHDSGGDRPGFAGGCWPIRFAAQQFCLCDRWFSSVPGPTSGESQISSLLRKELQLGHLRTLLIEPVDGHAGGVTGRNRNVRFLSLPFHAINAEIEARIQVAIGGDDQLVALDARSLGLIRMRVPQLPKGVVTPALRIFELLTGD